MTALLSVHKKNVFSISFSFKCTHRKVKCDTVGFMGLNMGLNESLVSLQSFLNTDPENAQLNGCVQTNKNTKTAFTIISD